MPEEIVSAIECEERERARILVVDDNKLNISILGHILSSNGYTNILTAENGQEALEKTRAHEPDMVVLDLMMPVLDGIGYCKEIRKDPRFRNLPILVQTAATSVKQRVEAFEAGASDFLAKPVEAGELLARTRVHLLQHRLLRDLQIYRKRVEGELKLARETQHSILPTAKELEAIEKSHDVAIAAHVVTSTELGGDFWGIHPISSKAFAFYMVDFSGHGVTAAMNTLRLHALIRSEAAQEGDPAAYLKTLNQKLCGLLAIGQFATAFYGVLDIEKELLRYATAASPSPVLVRGETRLAEIIDGSGFPLGVHKGADYKSQEMAFAKGDLLLLYSDALIETPDSSGKFLQSEAIGDLLSEGVAASPKGKGHLLPSQFMEKLLAIFNKRYLRGKPLADDLTLTILRRNDG